MTLLDSEINDITDHNEFLRNDKMVKYMMIVPFRNRGYFKLLEPDSAIDLTGKDIDPPIRLKRYFTSKIISYCNKNNMTPKEIGSMFVFIVLKTIRMRDIFNRIVNDDDRNKYITEHILDMSNQNYYITCHNKLTS